MTLHCFSATIHIVFQNSNCHSSISLLAYRDLGKKEESVEREEENSSYFQKWFENKLHIFRYIS